MEKKRIYILALLLTAVLAGKAQTTRDLYIFMDGSSEVTGWVNVFPIAPSENPYQYVIDSVKLVRHLKEPTGLRVERDADTHLPTVIWKPVPGALSYEVYKSVNKAPYKYAPGTIVQNGVTYEYYFTDKDIQVGTTSYRVRARGIVIESPLSSEIVSITIDPSEYQTIDGTYDVVEYINDDNYEWQQFRTYQITVSLDSSDQTSATVYNLFDLGGTAQAIYDPDEKTLYIPSYSVIGTHSTYGDVFVRGINDAWSAYTANVEFNFNEFGGTLSSGTFAVNVSAGSFGWFRIDAKKASGNASPAGTSPRKAQSRFTLKSMHLRRGDTQQNDFDTLQEFQGKIVQ